LKTFGGPACSGIDLKNGMLRLLRFMARAVKFPIAGLIYYARIF